MTAQELIEALSSFPPTWNVEVWVSKDTEKVVADVRRVAAVPKYPSVILTA